MVCQPGLHANGIATECRMCVTAGRNRAGSDLLFGPDVRTESGHRSYRHLHGAYQAGCEIVHGGSQVKLTFHGDTDLLVKRHAGVEDGKIPGAYQHGAGGSAGAVDGHAVAIVDEDDVVDRVDVVAVRRSGKVDDAGVDREVEDVAAVDRKSTR